jgi:hypothetical protein
MTSSKNTASSLVSGTLRSSPNRVRRLSSIEKEEVGRISEAGSDFDEDLLFFLRTFLPKKDEDPSLLFFLAETVATRATKRRIVDDVESFMVTMMIMIIFLG